MDPPKGLGKAWSSRGKLVVGEPSNLPGLDLAAQRLHKGERAEFAMAASVAFGGSAPALSVQGAPLQEERCFKLVRDP